MRKNYLQKLMLGFFLVIGFTSITFAQISEGGTPKSFGLINDKSDIDRIVLKSPNVEQLKYEDEFYEKNGIAERCGISISVGLTPDNAGTWTDLPNGGRIWRLEITSKGAKAIGLYYDKFEIPKNGKLFIYSADHSHVIGAFTNKNNPKHINFATEALYGDDIIIEYNEFTTSNVAKKISHNTSFKLEISNIAYFYKGFVDYSNPEKVNESDNCEVNINCSPVGDDWQDEKRGVARILMKDGGSYFWCSGSLVNNTSQDCTPYFLTAFHCAATASASDHNQWVFYFNYEASGCSNPSSEPSSNSITGCSVKTTSDINGGSDLQLLELNSTPSESWNPYYNGWTRSTSASTSGVGIHHPAGDIKKISTYSTTLQTSSPNISGSQMQSNSAWKVTWSSNSNGWGVTEGGSSGSPLFNASGLIVGTLSGGSSYCDHQTDPDFYGKFDKHWVNGNLATYLDPANTGATTLLGTNAPCGGSTGVTADFSGSPTTVTVGNTVTFTDNSTGTITSRSWSFPGGTPSSSTATNPTITYNTVGDYNVSLTVSDGTNSDTETKNTYIHVVNAGTTCDTLDVYGLGTSTATLYGVQDSDGGGYLSGTNGYGDTKKANFYNHNLTTNNKLEGVEFYFGRATSSTNPNITFEVLDGASGTPGSALASITKPLTEIVDAVNNSNGYYSVDFGGLNVTNDFFISFSCDLDMSAGDTIAIISNTDGDVAAGIGWELWSNGTWYAYSDANAWGKSISNAMFPIMCPDESNVKTLTNSDINIYPNPTTGIVNIEGIDNYNELRVLDIQGKTVMAINDFTNTLNVSNLPKGNYIIRIISDNSVITKKLTLIK